MLVAFNAPQEEIKEKIEGCDVLVFRSGPDINAEVMACAPKLSLLVRAGSGLDNLDLEYAKRNGILLRRIERPGARAVAELSFACMLALARQIRKADSLLRRGRWAKHELTGYLLSGKTLGIYGAGNIGTEVGRMGAAWGMEVIGCVRQPSLDRARSFERNHIRLTDSEEVLAKSDFVSLHVPLEPSTRKLIDERALTRMKPTAYLINLARGGVVDEQALLRALQESHIAGAGVDVHECEGEGQVSPLAELPNVILTPHIGAGTVDTQFEIGEEIISIITAHASGMLNDVRVEGLMQ